MFWCCVFIKYQDSVCACLRCVVKGPPRQSVKHDLAKKGHTDSLLGVKHVVKLCLVSLHLFRFFIPCPDGWSLKEKEIPYNYVSVVQSSCTAPCTSIYIFW